MSKYQLLSLKLTVLFSLGCYLKSLLNKVSGVPEYLSAFSVRVPKCLNTLIAWVPKCLSVLRGAAPKSECPIALSAWVHSECPSDLQVPKCPSALLVPSEWSPSVRVLSECYKCLSALWVSLDARSVSECLIRCDLYEILSMKRCFM